MIFNITKKIIIAIGLAALSSLAGAEEPIKIGVVVPLTGGAAAYGKQVEHGINTFLRENGDSIAGRKLKLIYRDNAGPNPEMSKRLAQELVIQEKVDVLMGFTHTPDALAAAPIATEAKIPMFLPLAATSVVTTKSPFIVRTSYTNAQVGLVMGQWAAKSKTKRVYSLVADFGPGYDAETWFKKGFEGGGGQMIGSVRVPANNKEFAPYLQRIKDAKPDAVFVFLTAGEPMVAFMKAFVDRELGKAGIKILALEGWADDDTLLAVGDAAIGAISAGIYSTDHQGAVNRQFVGNFNLVTGGKGQPNFTSVGAYDAMKVIANAIEVQGGKVDAEATIAAAKKFKYESPRGPILIDPDTRDIVENVYIRRVEKVNGKLVNREIDTYKMVKDPGK